MGQYYKPLAIKSHGNPVIGWMYSHDYHNGLKLMEHSYLNNSFVMAVETLLIEGGKWYKNPIVWAGDYAPNEENVKHNLFSLCKDENKLTPAEPQTMDKFRYIVNHTKKLYVDKTKVPGKDGYFIHPLPLLTAEGNGQGGGDFYGKEPKNLIGSWARNIISIETVIPEGYNELFFDLMER